MINVRKLVLPIAGLGTRLYPLTLKTPKALILAQGRPLVDYVLDETRGTSIKEAILITNLEQKVFFDKYILKAKKKFKFLDFQIRVQKKPLGTGDAVLPAKDLIKDEPFAFRFCDDILIAKKPVLDSLLKLHLKLQSTILSLRRVPKEQVSRFGVAGVRPLREQRGVSRIFKIIEKPSVDKAPSNLILIGAYILMPSLFQKIEILKKRLEGNSKNDCLPITDAFDLELKAKNKIYGWEFKGDYLDCGTLESLDKANQFLKNQKI